MTADKTERLSKPIAGTMVRLVTHPGICVIAKQAGLDFIMLDMEHSAMSMDATEKMFMTGRNVGLDVLVRVPELSRAYVSRVLDAGATGVMVPMVETISQAQDLVNWSKYPPLGNRGFGTNSGHSAYGDIADASDAMGQANRHNLTIAQIESVAGVEAANDIAAIAGIDALLVGPYDLSISLGRPGDLSCDEESAAIKKVADAASAHGKIFGLHAGLKMLTKWANEGLKLIMHSIDTAMLNSQMKSIHQDLRSLIEGART